MLARRPVKTNNPGCRRLTGAGGQPCRAARPDRAQRTGTQLSAFEWSCHENPGRQLVCAVARDVGSCPDSRSRASCESLSTAALPNATITLAQAVEAGSFTPPAAADADGRVSRAAGVLPRRRDAEADRRLRHQDRGLAAGGRLERQVPGGRQRRVQRRDRLPGDGDGACRRLRHQLDRHRPCRRQRELRARPPGEGDRLRLARGPRDDARRRRRSSPPTTTPRPKYSYWNGCSAGGRQAMKEAQRFPADFDGIIAGAPGLDWTGRAAQAVRVAQALEKNEAGAPVAGRRRSSFTGRCVEACDALDGVKDGLIEDPTRCKFDPGVLQCKGGDDGGLPDAGAGRDRAVDLLAAGQPEDQTGDRRPRAGQRAGMDRPGLDRIGSSDRTRSVPVHRLQRPEPGTSRSSTSIPTSCAPRTPTPTPSTRSIRT